MLYAYIYIYTNEYIQFLGFLRQKVYFIDMQNLGQAQIYVRMQKHVVSVTLILSRKQGVIFSK